MEYCPRGTCNLSVDGQDESPGTRCHGVEVVNEAIDLTPSMVVVDVEVSFGFCDYELEAGVGTPADDVRTVAPDARGNRVAGNAEEIHCDVHPRMALLYSLRGAND